MHFFKTSSASAVRHIFPPGVTREPGNKEKKRATGYPSSWGPENSVCDLELRGETTTTKNTDDNNN